jgi:8-oxo-dGTP pyrophosphatase MutT (NUDIX family)
MTSENRRIAAVRSLHLSHVEVFVFRRRRPRRVEFLTLRRSLHQRVLPGIWQPVTGRKKPHESLFQAAIREVREETSLEPVRWWALEAPILYFDSSLDAVVALPIFAAEVGAKDSVRLSPEHDAFVFVQAGAAGRRFLWESQRRALAAVTHDIVRGGRLAQALEVRPGIRDRQPRPSVRGRRVTSTP